MTTTETMRPMGTDYDPDSIAMPPMILDGENPTGYRAASYLNAPFRSPVEEVINSAPLLPHEVLSLEEDTPAVFTPEEQVEDVNNITDQIDHTPELEEPIDEFPELDSFSRTDLLSLQGETKEELRNLGPNDTKQQAELLRLLSAVTHRLS